MASAMASKSVASILEGLNLTRVERQTPVALDPVSRMLSDLVMHAARGKPPGEPLLAQYCTLELRELTADESRSFMNDVYRKLRRMMDRCVKPCSPRAVRCVRSMHVQPWLILSHSPQLASGGEARCCVRHRPTA